MSRRIPITRVCAMTIYEHFYILFQSRDLASMFLDINKSKMRQIIYNQLAMAFSTAESLSRSMECRAVRPCNDQRPVKNQSA